jgi:starch phosphorylase
LEDLAGNLWYSWDRATRALFARLNPALWDAVGHCPKAMLKRIDEQRLLDASSDPAFLDSLTRVLAAFDAYHAEPPFQQNSGGFRPNDLVAYFCAEFGVHESLPIYSGGLGILAGDHCKAASDFKLPFIAVGLLYRQGYFVQTIDAEGRQRAEYYDSEFDDLPIVAAQKDGADLKITLEFPSRKVQAKVWQTQVGHTRLYLLDADLPENADRDRHITHRLYGGDRTTRLEQELVLGVGGARALAALGLLPTVWHINEGHAAFLILERVRSLVEGGLSFESAIEAVASNTVFTTHTPVPAGHDHFADAVVLPYLKALFGALDVAPLGRPPSGGDFNMTALALRGSRYHNGVSRIHGGVSAKLLQEYWPHLTPEENPLGYITNGVHVATFLAPASAGCTGSATPASGKRSATFPITSSGACARTSRRACCTWCGTGSRCSTPATTAASRTSSDCCASPTRPSRTCSPSASAGASPPTSAPRCSSTTSTTSGASSATRSGRCCSSSPARRTPPTSLARS